MAWIQSFYDELGWGFDPDAGLDVGAYASPEGAFQQREESLRQKLQEVDSPSTELQRQHQTAQTRLANIARIEGGIDQRLSGIGAEIDRVRGEIDLSLAPPFTAEELKAFMASCLEFRKLVNHVAAQVMPVVSADGKSRETHTMINAAEQLALVGMIELAMLHFQSGRPDQAENQLAAARLELQTFIKVRSGNIDLLAKAPPEQVGVLGHTGQTVSSVQSVSRAMRERGFDALADRLTAGAEELTLAAQDWAQSNPGKTPKDMDNALVKLRVNLEAIVATAWTTERESDRLLEDIERIREAMLLNGLHFTVDKLDKDLAAFYPRAAREQSGQAINDALIDIRTAAQASLKEGRDARLAMEGIDPAKVSADIEGLAARQEKFFELGTLGKAADLLGSPRDAETGEKLRRIDNSDLPRETVDELQLQVTALRLLSESGSAEAMRLAQDKVAEVTALFDAIDADPKLYAKFASTLDALDKKLTGFDNSFEKIEIAKRNELKARVKAARAAYKTDKPQETQNTLDTLKTAVDDYEKEADWIKERARVLRQWTEVMDSKIAATGSTLKKLKPNDELEFKGGLTGNFGSFAARLAALRDKIEIGSRTGVEEATTLAQKLRKDFDDMEVLLAKYDNGKGKGIGDAEKATLKGFLGDAAAGQAEHQRHESMEKTYKRDQAKLVSDIAQIKSIITGKAIKGDPTEIDALASEAKALDTEMKATKLWADGWDRLAPLQQTLFRLRAEANASAGAVTGDIAEVAAGAQRAVLDFEIVLKDFYTDKILAVAVDDEQIKAALGPDAPARIRKFLAALAAALPTDAARALVAAVRDVADASMEMDARKAAREVALKALRTIMSYVSGFAPLNILLSHPFGEATAEFAALRKSLPRLEIRLLSALAT